MRSFILLFLISCFGCKLTTPGTNTGNPGADFSTPVSGYDGARHLGFKICEKIKSCSASSDFNICLDQAFNTLNYTNELGPTAGSFSTLAQLNIAEGTNQVNANPTNFANCLDAIRTLSCSDSLIQNAYFSHRPTDFTATNILFRSSGACALIY